MLRPDQPPRPIDLDATPITETEIVHAGQRLRAISVDCWKQAGASRPVTLEIAPGHFVLCHPDPESQ
jgi:hypothetical protein